MQPHRGRVTAMPWIPVTWYCIENNELCVTWFLVHEGDTWRARYAGHYCNISPSRVRYTNCTNMGWLRHCNLCTASTPSVMSSGEDILAGSLAFGPHAVVSAHQHCFLYPTHQLPHPNPPISSLCMIRFIMILCCMYLCVLSLKLHDCIALLELNQYCIGWQYMLHVLIRQGIML